MVFSLSPREFNNWPQDETQFTLIRHVASLNLQPGTETTISHHHLRWQVTITSITPVNKKNQHHSGNVAITFAPTMP
jgi:hypothetical protein